MGQHDEKKLGQPFEPTLLLHCFCRPRDAKRTQRRMIKQLHLTNYRLQLAPTWLLLVLKILNKNMHFNRTCCTLIKTKLLHSERIISSRPGFQA